MFSCFRLLVYLFSFCSHLYKPHLPTLETTLLDYYLPPHRFYAFARLSRCFAASGDLQSQNKNCTVAVFIVIRSRSKNLYYPTFLFCTVFSSVASCIIVYNFRVVFCPPCHGYGQETFTGFTIPPFFDRIWTTDFLHF